MSLPTIPSSTPVTIEEGSTTTVYDKWAIPSAPIRILPSGAIPMSVNFERVCVNSDGSFSVCPQIGTPARLSIEDIMTDPDVGAAAQAFFTALVTKALSTGVIS